MEISLNEVDLMADADSHASMTGIFAHACIRLWDPEAHVFQFRAMMEEMCPLFEEFCAIIGCDPNAPLVKHKDPGFGDLRLCPMVRQMEDMSCIGGIVLAETIRSLDRAALGFDDWTKGSITQVWLRAYLQVVTAPTSLPYNPSQYRMRRILITHPSTDIWTSWLVELGPNEILWFISWYNVTCFIQVSFRHSRVYLLGLTHCTWYYASRVLRQMGIDQTVPIMDDISADLAITPGVT
ncbi:hypothetical protein JCGZ_03685 [Jatropha curcas]|uniref:Aminotransferase-like plant mobile domain-containing protein n=1 Tax=Jatropha curcas TaxID=180498 RepID=A0A067KWN8_JATCU|nr:hypothetical protein JCGZ_03685 [Jatropha curcas]